MKTRLYRSIVLLIACGLLVQLSAHVQARQKTPPKKPKREKFGSSLKRLQWDSSKGAAVEQKKKPEAQSPADEGIQLKTLLVVFDVLVTDQNKREIVLGLTKDDFIITEDDKPQQVSTFLLGDDQRLPRSIVLILDWSGSQLAYFDKSIVAAKKLISQLGEKDEMAIVSDDVDLLTDFTSDKARLAAVLDKFVKRTKPDKPLLDRKFEGESRQFSALFASLRELVNNTDGRPIIIFQSDGDESTRLQEGTGPRLFFEEAPQFSLNDIYAASENSKATIYSVITNEPLVGLPRDVALEHGRKIMASTSPGLMKGTYEPSAREVAMLTERLAKGQAAMIRVATSTGAWATFLEKPDDADRIYGQILSDINHRYVVGYYPTNGARDGGLRRVKISVKGHPEYHVVGKTKYYAPGEKEGGR